MHALTTHVDPASDAAGTNRPAMEALVAELRERLDRVALGGPAASRERYSTVCSPSPDTVNGSA